MYSVSVAFPNSSGLYDESEGAKVYEYLCDIEGVEAGNYVVVSGYGLKVCKVLKTNSVPNAIASKYIVCKVDLAAYENRIKREEEKKKLLIALEKIEAERKQLKRFEDLAAESDDAKKLLEQYKSL